MSVLFLFEANTEEVWLGDVYTSWYRSFEIRELSEIVKSYREPCRGEPGRKGPKYS